jgi:uncharacterized protein YdeI (YjbR/CyaY-like superfamily)
MTPATRVDEFFAKSKHWREEYGVLREIVLGTGLTEELKWGHPCYTLEGKNVVLIHGFKEYCAILFMKGALMKDPKGMLIKQTANVQSGRQARFTSTPEIRKAASALKAYVREAMELEKAGKKVEYKKTSDFEMPAELKKKLRAAPALKTAFKALTPGRQRQYLLYFSSAKQSATREARIEKHAKRILAGKGLDD